MKKPENTSKAINKALENKRQASSIKSIVQKWNKYSLLEIFKKSEDIVSLNPGGFWKCSSFLILCRNCHVVHTPRNGDLRTLILFRDTKHKNTSFVKPKTQIIRITYTNDVFCLLCFKKEQKSPQMIYLFSYAVDDMEVGRCSGGIE